VYEKAAENGVLAGYPVVDLKVTLFDGSFHEVDSNEMAFKLAASWRLKKAFKRLGPVLLRADHESGSGSTGRVPR